MVGPTDKSSVVPGWSLCAPQLHGELSLSTIERWSLRKLQRGKLSSGYCWRKGYRTALGKGIEIKATGTSSRL